MTEIATGTDALRQAVRAKPLNTAVFARDLGIPNETFLAFTEGRVELKPDILKALAGHLWGGHIAYNVERDCLQSANRTEPRPMGAVPPAVRCVGCAAVCKTNARPAAAEAVTSAGASARGSRHGWSIASTISKMRYPGTMH